MKQEEEKKIATLQRGASGKKIKAPADLVDATNQVPVVIDNDDQDEEEEDDEDDEDETDDSDEDDDDDDDENDDNEENAAHQDDHFGECR